MIASTLPTPGIRPVGYPATGSHVQSYAEPDLFHEVARLNTRGPSRSAGSVVGSFHDYRYGLSRSSLRPVVPAGC